MYIIKKCLRKMIKSINMFNETLRNLFLEMIYKNIMTT